MFEHGQCRCPYQPPSRSARARRRARPSPALPHIARACSRISRGYRRRRGRFRRDAYGATRRAHARAPRTRASGRGSPRTASRAPRRSAASRAAVDRGTPRSVDACRRGLRLRLRRANRAGGRRGSGRRSCFLAARESAFPSCARPRSRHRGDCRSEKGRGDPTTSCSRRAGAPPSRSWSTPGSFPA